MTTPDGCHDEQPKKLVVIYSPPAMIGHLVSTVELGKLLAEHGLKVTIALGGQADDHKAAGSTTANPLLEGVGAAHSDLSVHRLPQITRPSHVPAHDHVAQAFELARASTTDLRDFLRSTSPAALLLDFFCGSAVDVGAELGIPTYFFFTSGVAGLAFLLYQPVIHGQTTLNLRDLGGDLLHAPGLPPVPADHLAEAVLDRNSLSSRHFRALSEQLNNSQGVIVNSFRSLEPRATGAIVAGLCTPPGRRAPPLHCIGPLIKSEVGAKRHECLVWLDAQPKASVVFLCFGSLGRFSAEQTKHVARGLEMSGQRFLWVVRRPPGDDDEQQPDPDLDWTGSALLPEGFLARTKDRGLVVRSWAPQREVLAHSAVGGFVTHCGWNSVLEAVVGGVPMLAWPMYAEQRMNKVFLVEEMRLAVAVEGYDKEMVKDEEVAEKVRWLMESDGGAELRQRTWAAMRQAKEALCDGGESKIALLELVRHWKMLAWTGEWRKGRTQTR
ncbi:UDP-glycosyltransferase 1-like [Phragmites australis]|uniref:UDP-glycosyltransferase 1-like n=1 Tax=Phragmites australis TaxID=29695 RepID=UPI002D79ECE9|nr:UDP-glycosyltransferase 1-like [Phragmites australis]